MAVNVVQAARVPPHSACAWFHELRPTPGYSVHLKVALPPSGLPPIFSLFFHPHGGISIAVENLDRSLANATGQPRPAASEVQGAAVRAQSEKQEKASCVGKRLFRGRGGGLPVPVGRST